MPIRLNGLPRSAWFTSTVTTVFFSSSENARRWCSFSEGPLEVSAACLCLKKVVGDKLAIKAAFRIDSPLLQAITAPRKRSAARFVARAILLEDMLVSDRIQVLARGQRLRLGDDLIRGGRKEEVSASSWELLNNCPGIFVQHHVYVSEMNITEPLVSQTRFATSFCFFTRSASSYCLGT